MSDKHCGRLHIVSRSLNVLRSEGFSGIYRRIKERIRSKCKWSQLHAFVVSSQPGQVSNPSAFPTRLDPGIVRASERAQEFPSSLEFKQLTLLDIDEIEELTGIDHWRIPKSETLEKLQDGWHCYVAKYQGRIVANCWTTSGPELYESSLQRSFTLAENEFYGWRAFCVPAFRGRGVLAWLDSRITDHRAMTEGAKSHIGWVRVDNKAMLRSLFMTRRSIVGRLGFIEAFGIRLHYLWGRRALRATRKRFFIQRQKYTG